MTFYALDSNAVISAIGGKASKLQRRLLSCPPGTIFLPTIVAHELYYGSFRSQRIEHNLRVFHRLAEDFMILEFDLTDARVSAEIRATLAARGTPIGPYDALIAGQAKARGLTVVTNNIREFSRVHGLNVEDWTL